MKKIIVIAAALFSFGYIAMAEVSRSEANNTGIVSYQDKVKITEAELPQAVKDALAKDYKDYTVGDVYKAGENFSIELKKGTETKTVTLDKDGKEAKVGA
jgi:hypothetical protein